MMSSEYIEEQSTSTHADMRRKGFWDTPKGVIINNGLIASELMEAFEGVRNNKRVEPDMVKIALEAIAAQSNWTDLGRESYAQLYKMGIKDTVEAEFAGTCIRCVDTIGGRIREGGGFIMDGQNQNIRCDLSYIAANVEEQIARALEGAERVDGGELENDMLAEAIINMLPAALGIQTGGAELGYLTELASVVETLKNVCLLSRWFGIDLLTHIQLECAYNRTRPYKHNKGF